eukprot:m.52672 g.52672  ORF g.52672 m.52672 type:complete len:78 (-) comp21640_c0_seq2:5-238(-)
MGHVCKEKPQKSSDINFLTTEVQKIALIKTKTIINGIPLLCWYSCCWSLVGGATTDIPHQPPMLKSTNERLTHMLRL